MDTGHRRGISGPTQRWTQNIEEASVDQHNAGQRTWEKRYQWTNITVDKDIRRRGITGPTQLWIQDIRDTLSMKTAWWKTGFCKEAATWSPWWLEFVEAPVAIERPNLSVQALQCTQPSFSCSFDESSIKLCNTQKWIGQKLIETAATTTQQWHHHYGLLLLLCVHKLHLTWT